MSSCLSCGAQNQSGKFCAHCGGSLGAQPPQGQHPAPGQMNAGYQPLVPGPAPATVPQRPSGAVWLGVGAAAAVLLVGGAAMMLTGRSSEPAVASQPAPSTTQQPSQGTAPQPAPSSPSKSSANKLPSDPNNPLVGGYIRIRVPGVAYTSTQGDTTKFYVSSGVMTSGSLLINTDGTYAWNSSYDGKLIQGNWVKDGQDIILKKAQEGKDWKVTKGNASSGGDIVIMDGSTWYLADRARE